MSVSDVEMLDWNMEKDNDDCPAIFWKYSSEHEDNSSEKNCFEFITFDIDDDDDNYNDITLHPLDYLINLPTRIHSWFGIRRILIVDLQMGYITRKYCNYFPMEFYICYMDLYDTTICKTYWGVIKKPIQFHMLTLHDKRRQYFSSLSHGLPWKDYDHFWTEEKLIFTLKKYPHDLIVTRGKQKFIYLTDFVQLDKNKIAHFKDNFDNNVFCGLHNFIPHKLDMNKVQRRCAKFHGQTMYELIAREIMPHKEK